MYGRTLITIGICALGAIAIALIAGCAASGAGAAESPTETFTRLQTEYAERKPRGGHSTADARANCKRVAEVVAAFAIAKQDAPELYVTWAIENDWATCHQVGYLLNGKPTGTR